MSWNYRIGVKRFSYKEAFPDNPKMWDHGDHNLFSIIEVFYDEDGNPEGYGESDPTKNWENIEDLVGTMDLVLLAKNKPILDLDNWPNEWNDGKKKIPDNDFTCVKCGTGFDAGEVCPKCNKND